MRKLISIIFSCLMFTVCGIFFTSCQREYSDEGGISNATQSGTAVYILDGAGSACTASPLMGNYHTGTPLTSGNTIQLLLNVTIIGTYTLTTSTLNGIHFSASGSFTTTGRQTIILTGSGTPISEGGFTFILPGGSGCSFTVVVIKPPMVTAGFTLAGAAGNCSNPLINGTYTPGNSLTNANSVIINVNVNTVGAYSVKTDTLDGISFSASGIFAGTGNQTVRLVGSGTPDFARNLLFTLITGTSSCTFNIVVQDPQPLATYVLESGSGNANPCVYSVQGTYISNTHLSNSNTVTIRVFVTAIGNFTIATNTVNGMIFSYSGSFATPGTHFVILKGIGTPITQGTHTFTPRIVGPHPLGGDACGFDVVVQ